MLSSHYSEEPRAQLILRPNRSWTWRANQWFIIILMAISLCLAVTFALLGYWVILPFTILEMSVLFACLWYCVHRSLRQEVLILSPEHLVLERGQQTAVAQDIERHVFDRYFARFDVKNSSRLNGRKLIQLRYKDELYEVGQFLNDDDQVQLLSELRKAIHHVEHPLPNAG